MTKRAFAQILEKRPDCHLEMENVRRLEADVVIALDAVQRGRLGLDAARRKFTASSLGILAAYKRRQRSRILLNNFVIISTLVS